MLKNPEYVSPPESPRSLSSIVEAEQRERQALLREIAALEQAERLALSMFEQFKRRLEAAESARAAKLSRLDQIKHREDPKLRQALKGKLPLVQDIECQFDVATGKSHISFEWCEADQARLIDEFFKMFILTGHASVVPEPHNTHQPRILIEITTEQRKELLEGLERNAFADLPQVRSMTKIGLTP